MLSWGCVRIYRCLLVIEGLTRSSSAGRPALALEFQGIKPPSRLTRDTEVNLACNVSLTQGDVANGVELWFASSRAFLFLGPKTVSADYLEPGLHGVTLQCPFTLKKGLPWRPKLRIRAPSGAGRFEMHYRLVCEGFDGGDQKFEIEVV